jgi:hypothetical protein
MKFNYKKVASVLASAVMLSSTVGFAAAASYPLPFVVSGSSDVAIVVGSASVVAPSDFNSATDIQASLNKLVPGAALTTSTTSGGDSFLLSKTSTKLNLGDGISTVWGTAVTKSDLPTLLADGVYRNKNNNEYKSTQKLDLGNLTFADFSDSDYNNKVPTLGFKLSSNAYVANYTIDFITRPESVTGSSGDATDFENTKLTILGKEYYILDFKNTSTPKIILLDSATTSMLSEGDSKQLTIDGKTYDVSIAFISDNAVKFTVNGETTNTLSSTANTYKLTDGTFIGVKEINVQNYQGGVKSVEFSLGKGKLELTHDAVIKLNDKNVDDIYAFISLTTSGANTLINKITLKWIVSDESFLAPGKELLMPGFEAVKYTIANTTMPTKEVTTVDYSGDDVIELKTKIKDGDVTIPLLKASTSTGLFDDIGKAADQKLATSNSTALVYNATSGESDVFVVSWSDGRTAESYYLKASVAGDTTTGVNSTDIKNAITGDILCDDKQVASVCSIGGSNIELTVTAIGFISNAVAKNVTLTVNSGGSFNQLYTAEGMKIQLPYWVTDASNSTRQGALNTNSNLTAGNGNNKTLWTLWMSEEDKNGNLNVSNLYINLTTSGTTTKKVTASTVGGTYTAYETESNSKLWESYVYSDLASRVTLDKANSDQYSADVEYHGGEVFANVYISSPSVVITPGTGGQVLVFRDNEVESFKGKNLIVVGGSCINMAAAKILGSDTVLCGDDFTLAAKVSAGGYIIKTVTSPYNAAGATKVAMLVAGYNAADTQAAVAKLLSTGAKSDVGSSEVFPQVTA